MCRWFITDYFIHNLYGAGKGNRKDCVGGNVGGLFGCFVSQFFTWNDGITKEPLNEDGRRLMELMKLELKRYVDLIK